ncbi:MAG: double-strand break repair protein AddB [Pseudomonadota bacterium]
MADRGDASPTVYTISSNRAFADSLAKGLIKRFGADPVGLASGRVLLPNNRAVRTLTEAFVRESGAGLLLPRLIPIGDPELDERIGGALDPADALDPIPPAIEPTERLFALAGIVGRDGKGAAESLRLAADLARTLDALRIEQVDPARLADVVSAAEDSAEHWQKSLQILQAIVTHWPAILAQHGRIDLAERRNLLLERIAQRWRDRPPPGFTVAAGITTAAPAIAALQARVATMPGGEVVLPGLWLDDVLPVAEWDALGPDGDGRIEANHPQFHLKHLLDRMGINRDDVRVWPASAGARSPARRAKAVANAMAAPAFSHKWETLKRAERHFDHVRLAEFPDAAAEAQGVALALREALEMPGRTAALVTPDRQLAGRVSALLERWGIEADDSAGQPLSQSAAASLILAFGAVAAEDLAPVALLALLKHPLVGGEGDQRLRWLDDARALDEALRGPRPGAGLAGLDRHFAEEKVAPIWARVRPLLALLDGLLDQPVSLAFFAQRLADSAEALAGMRAWSGPDGRMMAGLLSEWQALPAATTLMVSSEDAVPLLRQLLDSHSLRPPYGKHPRIFIWGLLEARLQRADLIVMGGLNEGSWPALAAPDPWLPPRVRAKLDMPTLESRIGLTAHDFASALGAPEVLITRARRDSRSPTVASRFWLRLRAVDPELALDTDLLRLAIALDDPGPVTPAAHPQPVPSLEQRPKVISVTDVDRLKADPYAFYAKAILKLRLWNPLDQDPTAAWKGTAVHDVLERWFKEDDCAPDALIPRVKTMLRDPAVHPLVRALWEPRLIEGVQWVVDQSVTDRASGRVPAAAEVSGEVTIAGVKLHGKADRLDKIGGGASAIIDYKTGNAPTAKVIASGFALQLGLLGLIAEAGGFGPDFAAPDCLEYWSLAKDKRAFGYRRSASGKQSTGEFLAMTADVFGIAARDWLTGTRAFTAKLNPAFAPYGDYDQLMRLEEWYGRN